MRLMDKRNKAIENGVAVVDLPAPEAGNKLFYDDDLKGFACRVTSTGKRSFVLNYWVPGRERRITIGAYPAWTVAAAREEAKALRQRIDKGEDPMADRHEERAAPTIDDLAKDYEERHAARKRTGAADVATLHRFILPALGKFKVRDVTHRQIEDFHRDRSKTSPTQANREVALLSKMFALAMKWNFREDNPAKGIERNPEERRTRYLSGDELQRLSAVLLNHPNRQSANAIRLLLLTGARRGEMLSATWPQFDLATGVWVKPSSHTKQKKEHRVPLSAPALQLLSEMKTESESEFLFPGRDTPVAQAGIKSFWQSVCKAAEITDCHVHDLRHTYASILASAGLSLPIIGALLGHTQAQTTARYAHLMDDPLRAATERAGVVLEAAGKPGKTADVVQLRKGN